MVKITLINLWNELNDLKRSKKFIWGLYFIENFLNVKHSCKLNFIVFITKIYYKKKQCSDFFISALIQISNDNKLFKEKLFISLLCLSQPSSCIKSLGNKTNFTSLTRNEVSFSIYFNLRWLIVLKTLLCHYTAQNEWKFVYYNFCMQKF